MLLFDFLQVLFFIFYKVTIVSEFTSTTLDALLSEEALAASNATVSTGGTGDDLTAMDLLDTFTVY
jgi:hypothetical protein